MTNQKQILGILSDRYGVGVVAADPVTILWAAERCDHPKDALSAANSIRKRHGVVPAYAPYGHICF